MTFQQTIPLSVGDQEIYVVFDLNTGLLGFVREDEGQVDYTFGNAPVEYRKAFSAFVEANSSGVHKTNTKFCRKGALGRHLLNFTDKSN